MKEFEKGPNLQIIKFFCICSIQPPFTFMSCLKQFQHVWHIRMTLCATLQEIEDGGKVERWRGKFSTYLQKPYYYFYTI